MQCPCGGQSGVRPIRPVPTPSGDRSPPSLNPIYTPFTPSHNTLSHPLPSTDHPGKHRLARLAFIPPSPTPPFTPFHHPTLSLPLITHPLITLLSHPLPYTHLLGKHRLARLALVPVRSALHRPRPNGPCAGQTPLRTRHSLPSGMTVQPLRIV